MSFSATFVRRPIATGLLAFALFLAGLVCARLLPVALLPQTAFPTIQVLTFLPGASPETMATTVATPLERRFGRIAALTELTSVSTVGATVVTLQFDLGRSLDGAARDVQAAINAASADLPSNLPTPPIWQKADPTDPPIVVLAFTSDTLPLAAVSDAVTTVVAPRLSRVRGVGQVFLTSNYQPAVRVQADPRALAGAGLTLEDLRRVIEQGTGDGPKGELLTPTRSKTIAANDQLVGARAYGDLIVATDAQGGAVRLGDVAHVYDGVQNERAAAFIDGKRGMIVGVTREPGANIVETTDRIRDLLPTLRAMTSAAIQMDIRFDRSASMRVSVEEGERMLVLSVVLVVAAVLLFFRSVRATAIAAITAPLSLIGSLVAMYFLDYTIDNLSLMALTVAAGFVVDDAIVVTENIIRHLEAGVTPLDAAIRGATQITPTVVSITASLVAVFIPVLFMGGIIGRLFREFAMTLSVAVAVSMVVSLTLTPMIAARLLRPVHVERGVARALELAYSAVLRGYERTLWLSIRFRRLVLVATLATMALTVWLYVTIPKGLFPQQDVGLITAISEAPQDVSFASMASRQTAIDRVLAADPDVGHVISVVGGGLLANTANTGTLFLELKPDKTTRAENVVDRLRKAVGTSGALMTYFQVVQDIRVGGKLARTQYQYVLTDPDLAELRAWSPRVLQKLRTIPLLRDVATDLQSGGVEVALHLRRDEAARVGVTPQSLDETLNDAYGQRQVATLFTTTGQYRTVLEVGGEFATDPGSIRHLYVRSTDGSSIVPLSQLTESSVQPTALAVRRHDQFPATTISFNLAPGVALGEAVDAVHSAEAELGMPASMHATFAGTAEAFAASHSNQPWLMLAALVVVYLVLGMLYESLIHPATIISTIPSAGAGSLLTLTALGTELSIVALIGVFLVIGIVLKNAILIVDFAIAAERVDGLAPHEAIARAAVQRFRPIVMTTLAALAGAVPLLLGHGVGTEFRRPLGIAIIGGLAFSQLFTLFTTPAVYLALHRTARGVMAPHDRIASWHR